MKADAATRKAARAAIAESQRDLAVRQPAGAAALTKFFVASTAPALPDANAEAQLMIADTEYIAAEKSWSKVFDPLGALRDEEAATAQELTNLGMYVEEAKGIAPQAETSAAELEKLA